MLARTRERDGLLLCTCVLLCAALAAAAERESQLSQAPFIMGSRFGRSPPRLLLPRNDKFFFSSRYGKRSPAPLEPPDAPLPPPPPPPPALALLPPPRRPQLLCEYTGMQSLYRCHPANRRLDDSSSEED